MKKFAAVLLAVLCFVAGMITMHEIDSANADSDGIDRSGGIRYDVDLYVTMKKAYVYFQLKDKYYHGHDWCSFVDFNGDYTPTEISVFEAVERGYTPCPDCFIDTVQIGGWGN